MSDTEMKRRKAICEVAGVEEIEDLSDGFHTFRQLYYQRMMLFATIVKQNKDKAWKSFRHKDGELCFGGGWFVVGIDTPEGSYTYHYEDNYFSLFDCEELECGKHWDGHTEKDVTRLLSLPSAEPEYKELQDWKTDFKNFVEWLDIPRDDYKGIMEYIDEVSSAEPERKKGKWIDDGTELGCCCSECGITLDDYFDSALYEICLSKIPNFCPNCGADMRQPEEESE